LPLCDRCGEEIALANDLDQAGDIDRRRHLVLVAGKPCRLAPTLWRLFTLLYQHRSDVVDNDRLHAELCHEMEHPLVANMVKENVRRLRRALAGSRYEIVNHPTLGYELIVNARRRTRRVAGASDAPSSVDATSSTQS
jgi:DNA-binding response OmpR family regulator